MTTPQDKRDLDRAWQGTSDTVREWLTERREASSKGNPWAEEQLKVFLKHYRASGSGVQAHRRLVGNHEQTGLL